MQDDKKKAKKVKKPGTSLFRAIAIHQAVSACIPLFRPFVLPKSGTGPELRKMEKKAKKEVILQFSVRFCFHESRQVSSNMYRV